MKKINTKSEITAKMMKEEKLVLTYSANCSDHYSYLKITTEGYRTCSFRPGEIFTNDFGTLAEAKKSLTINHF